VTIIIIRFIVLSPKQQISSPLIASRVKRSGRANQFDPRRKWRELFGNPVTNAKKFTVQGKAGLGGWYDLQIPKWNGSP
jgi:hypothetical protein